MDTDEPQACFHCEQPETASPLISLRYAGRSLWICPRCMPTLIHSTAELAARLNEIARSDPGSPPR